jgi:hypothetical protein
MLPFRQMALRRLFVEFLDLPLLDSNGSLRTFPEACAEAITIYLTDEFCLTIYDLNSPLGTGWDTDAAAIALLLIDLDYLPQYFG